ncbi:hypothetical protein X975_08559, partial [Stegodyphus mimosarum]
MENCQEAISLLEFSANVIIFNLKCKNLSFHSSFRQNNKMAQKTRLNRYQSMY